MQISGWYSCIFLTGVLPSCVYGTPWIPEPTWWPHLYGHPEAAGPVYRTEPPHLDPQSTIRGPTAALISTLIWIQSTSATKIHFFPNKTRRDTRVSQNSSCYLRKAICVVSNFTNKDFVGIKRNPTHLLTQLAPDKIFWLTLRWAMWMFCWPRSKSSHITEIQFSATTSATAPSKTLTHSILVFMVNIYVELHHRQSLDTSDYWCTLLNTCLYMWQESRQQTH